jgi:hypothetical protein
MPNVDNAFAMAQIRSRSFLGEASVLPSINLTANLQILCYPGHIRIQNTMLPTAMGSNLQKRASIMNQRILSLHVLFPGP